MSCNCENKCSETTTGCSCYGNGIVIPTGPQGEQGEQGPQGIQGPVGPQGPAGTEAPLVWLPIVLVNDWTDVGETPPAYAIDAVKGLLYLSGRISNSVLEPSKYIFWNAAPSQTVITDTMVFEAVTNLVVKLRLFATNTMGYVAPSATNVLLDLDSAPVIRLR